MIQETTNAVLSNAVTFADVSSLVTGLTITPTDPTSGSNVSMDLTFSDPNDILKPGDTIKVSWPSSGDAYLQGYSSSFPLVDPKTGLTLANVVVRDGSAVVTFTNEVTKLHDISGSVHFKAKAMNVAAGDTEDKKTIQVTSGTQSSSLTITKPGSSGEIPNFYNKGGAILPSTPHQINWYLNVNVPKGDVSQPVTVTDQIQKGQSLEASSFEIYSPTNSEVYSGTDAIQDFEAAHPGCSITYSVANGTVDVTLNPTTVNATNWTIAFLTQITDNTLTSLKNNSSATYWPVGATTSESITSNASVAAVSSGGDISGVPRGALMIKKLLDDGNSSSSATPLSGIQFKLVRADGEDITPGNTFVILTTNTAGTAEIKDLPDGAYILTEINTPDWLKPLSEPITFEIDASAAQGILKTISNVKRTIDITGNKVWDSSESEHPTIWLKLYRSTDSGTPEAVPNAPIQELLSGTTNATWTGLDYADDSGNIYTYSIREVNAEGIDYTPVGYKNTEAGLTVTNTLETTSLTINKVWVDANNQDGLRPNKVTVTLQANGTVTGTPVELSGNQWTYTWNNLPVYNQGKKILYTVQEDTIAGYEATTSGINSGVITLTNTHIPETTSLTVNKVWVDANNQDGLRPNKITVTLQANGTATGTPVELSGNQWTYTWNNLPVYNQGKKILYTVQEDTIAGYEATTSGINSGVITLTNTHIPETTSLTVNKVWVDANNQDGLRPNKITVTLQANGTATGTSVELSGNQWTYTWNNLPIYKNGKKIVYTVQENPITGYQSTISNISSGIITITNTYHPHNITQPRCCCCCQCECCYCCGCRCCHCCKCGYCHYYRCRY